MEQVTLAARHRCLWLPKFGNSLDEYEDAIACDEQSGRFAIADGASESICAREWALLLCQTFTEPATVGDDSGIWIRTAQRRWRKEIATQPQLWHVQEKLRDGSYATFLGVAIEPSGQWKAMAVGDSCLFQIHNDTLLRAFPVGKAEAFGTRPTLIGSRQRTGLRATAATGTANPGDQFLLMTDALAAWFLHEYENDEYENGRTPWQELASLTTETFVTWVDTHRRDRTLKNDDVTLLVIDLGLTNS